MWERTTTQLLVCKSHKSKHGCLRQPSGCGPIGLPLHHHRTKGGGGWDPLSNTHKHVYTHKHTHLMVTTWLDQNKAFRQALFSAELIFLKGARSDVLVSKTFILVFSEWGPSISKLVIMYTYLTNFWHFFLSFLRALVRTVDFFSQLSYQYVNNIILIIFPWRLFLSPV